MSNIKIPISALKYIYFATLEKSKLEITNFDDKDLGTLIKEGNFDGTSQSNLYLSCNYNIPLLGIDENDNEKYFDIKTGKTIEKKDYGHYVLIWGSNNIQSASVIRYCLEYWKNKDDEKYKTKFEELEGKKNIEIIFILSDSADKIFNINGWDEMIKNINNWIENNCSNGSL